MPPTTPGTERQGQPPEPWPIFFLVFYFVIWRNIEMSFRDALAALRALSDENRLRALMAVSDRELCVCQIIELLQLSPSTVSKHMSILRDADLVASRKEGRWIHYRLSLEYAAPEVKALVETLREQLRESGRARQDKEMLREILAMDPSVLSRRQAEGGSDDNEMEQTAPNSSCCG